MTTNNLFPTRVTFDDIVFTNRNHEYGAYFLRKRYNTYLLIAFFTAFTFVVSSVVAPYVLSSRKMATAIFKPDTPAEFTDVTPPPPPPPPPVPEPPLNKVAFVPPVVVDSKVDLEDIKINDEIVAESGPVEPPKTLVVTEPTIGSEIVEDTKPFLNVEESATFEGGDLNTFRKWVAEHIVYPDVAAGNLLDGKVILQFVVGKKGNVEDVKVLRGVDPLLDQEAVRVLQSSPAWKPGRQGGRDVRQQFSLPITFKLTR
jgi:protein TonB